VQRDSEALVLDEKTRPAFGKAAQPEGNIVESRGSPGMRMHAVPAMLAAVASRDREFRRGLAENLVDLLERTSTDDCQPAFELPRELRQESAGTRVRANIIGPIGNLQQRPIEIEKQRGRLQNVGGGHR
jgi:hypothetical protein